MMPAFTISIYLGRQFLVWLAIAVSICAFVGFLGDMGETSRVASRGEDTGILTIIGLSLLRFPNLIQEILPFAFLFGSIGYFARLSTTHELIVARAAGMSVWQFLAPSVMITLTIGILVVAIWHPMAAWMSGTAKTIEKNITYGTANQLTVSDNGLWLREDTSAISKTYAIIHTPQIISSDPVILKKVSYFSFSADGRNLERIDAETAQLAQNEWVFKKAWLINETGNVKEFNTLVRATNLKPNQIQENFVPPRTVSFWQLPKFIALANEAGFPIEEYRMYFHSLLAKPLLLCAMVLIAATFGLHFSRMGSSTRLILMAIVTGLTLFFFTDLMNTVGAIGLLPPPLAAWAPSTIATLIGITLLLHQEDG